MDLTILFLAKLIETGSEIVGNCRGNCTGFHLSVNVVTRSVSPLRIIYGVVSNPCVSIYIIRALNLSNTPESLQHVEDPAAIHRYLRECVDHLYVLLAH